MTKWSKYQQAVFEDVANGSGHTVIKAVAGSGKTTTIVESMKYIPPGFSTLFVAFNKSIAEELKKKAPRGVEVSTLHSYGLKAITASLGRLRIENNRVHRIIDDMSLQLPKVIVAIGKELGMDREEAEEAAEPFRFDLVKTVSLAKGSLAGDEQKIDELVDSFGIEYPGRSPFQGVILEEHLQAKFREAFVKDVFEVMTRCGDTSDGMIDFDDMIWLPVVLDLRQRKFDRVFVDETQDLNP